MIVSAGDRGKCWILERPKPQLLPLLKQLTSVLLCLTVPSCPCFRSCDEVGLVFLRQVIPDSLQRFEFRVLSRDFQRNFTKLQANTVSSCEALQFCVIHLQGCSKRHNHEPGGDAFPSQQTADMLCSAVDGPGPRGAEPSPSDPRYFRSVRKPVPGLGNIVHPEELRSAGQSVSNPD